MTAITTRLVRLTACFVCLALAAPALAQNAPPPTFKTSTNLVALNVVVTDHNARYTTDLTADDFEVYEDGVRQDLRVFAAADVPLDLILLLDSSSSMTDKLDVMHRAAKGFLGTLRPDDRAAVVSFADGVRVLQPLTSEVARAEAAVESTGAKGGTALHNALYVALKEFGESAVVSGDIRRQAIAVLSDGEDTASLLSFDDVLDLARRSGVSIYTIGLKGESVNAAQPYFSQADYAMKQLASETGAMPFFPQSIHELKGIYAAIADELESQYALGYVPRNTREDGKYRRVVVRVADRPELKPRTRTGYFLAVDSMASAPGGQR